VNGPLENWEKEIARAEVGQIVSAALLDWCGGSNPGLVTLSMIDPTFWENWRTANPIPVIDRVFSRGNFVWVRVS
jgi:hypothetical protein